MIHTLKINGELWVVQNHNGVMNTAHKGNLGLNSEQYQLIDGSILIVDILPFKLENVCRKPVPAEIEAAGFCAMPLGHESADLPHFGVGISEPTAFIRQVSMRSPIYDEAICGTEPVRPAAARPDADAILAEA